MNTNVLRELLDGLPLGSIRWFDRIGSTNDEALHWAKEGAPHFALVVADEQTAGRGRMGRPWFTPAGSALAFSVIINPAQLTITAFSRLSALGALAVCTALEQRFNLHPQIKWPNDVLLLRRKFAGVLVEASWQGGELEAVVLGVGINIARESVPPTDNLLFPATSLEHALGKPVERWVVLRDVLDALSDWLSRLHTHDFLRAWEEHLAFRGQWVQIHPEGQSPIEGVLAGIAKDGSLLLCLPSGETRIVSAGEVHLRPLGVDTC